MPWLIHLAIVDDHTLFRAGIRAILASHSDVSIVCEASTARDGFAAVTRQPCDCALVDYHLPDEDGPWLVRELLRVQADLPILLLSQHVEPDKVRHAMDCGCSGYLVKTAEEQELLTAIRIVAAGGIYVHPAVAQALRGPRSGSGSYSSREMDIMRLLRRGLSNAEIADSLHVSLGTVKRALLILYKRLGVTDRTQLLAEAYARGLLAPPPSS